MAIEHMGGAGPDAQLPRVKPLLRHEPLGPASPSPPSAAPKVGLIGPVQPFRGGIAQYTTQLHRALARQADLLTLSFTRQYPAWLFPGASDRDPEYAGRQESGVEYLIDPYDPRSWLCAAERLRAQGAAQVVIAWWTAYWAPCLGVIARRLRRFGIRVTLLCHNVQDHEDSWLNARVAGFALALAYHYDRPVVVTRVGGLPDVVEEGASGFIVPSADPQALAQAIRACRGFKPSADALARLKGRMSWSSLAAALVDSPVLP